MSLFAGNMSFQTAAADLTALFQPFGQVGRIHIVNRSRWNKLCSTRFTPR